jgi:hypothetical protein
MRNLGFLVFLGVGIYSQLYLDQLLERERETAPTDWELDGRPSVWFCAFLGAVFAASR